MTLGRTGIDAGGNIADGVIVRRDVVAVPKVRPQADEMARVMLRCAQAPGPDPADFGRSVHGPLYAANTGWFGTAPLRSCGMGPQCFAVSRPRQQILVPFGRSAARP